MWLKAKSPLTRPGSYVMCDGSSYTGPGDHGDGSLQAGRITGPWTHTMDEAGEAGVGKQRVCARAPQPGGAAHSGQSKCSLAPTGC